MKIRIINGSIDDDIGDILWQNMKAESRGEKLGIGQSVLNDCPEDAIFCRSLCKPGDYLDFIKMAHAAGLRGEKLTITEEKRRGINYASKNNR